MPQLGRLSVPSSSYQIILRACLLGALLLGTGDAVAQAAERHPQLAQAIASEPPPPGKSPAYDAAFKAMQEDPGNSDKAMRFAEAAALAGDYEGAIGALERVLVFNPDLATVRAQLGILYYRLGAQARAQEYLTQALEKDLSGPLVAHARETPALSEKALGNHRFSGSLGLG